MHVDQEFKKVGKISMQEEKDREIFIQMFIKAPNTKILFRYTIQGSFHGLKVRSEESLSTSNYTMIFERTKEV